MFIPCDLLPGGCYWLDQDWAPDSRHAWNVPTLPIWNGDSELTSPFIKVRTKGEAEVAKLGSNFGSKVDLRGHAFDILKFCTSYLMLVLSLDSFCVSVSMKCRRCIQIITENQPWGRVWTFEERVTETEKFVPILRSPEERRSEITEISVRGKRDPRR